MIVGITGPICAGKGIVGNILVELGFERFSLADEIREEARRRGIPLTRKTLQDLGDEVRKEEGAGAWARRVANKIVGDKNYVIESIRNPAEVEVFRAFQDFFLFCIEASDFIRFQRMVKRGREEDPRTFEEFLAVEAKDRGIGQATYGQQNEACWKMADMTIANESGIDELKEDVRKMVNGIEMTKKQKLVRDNIPKLYSLRRFHIADNEEYKAELIKLLQEEVDDFKKGQKTDALVDINEVVRTIAETHGVNSNDLEFMRMDKVERRGAFKKKYIWEKE